ncbi:MAG TPA: DUF5818 domain-containing protein [Thermoanaerobaculia bacterium]|nr:DUF5818 domain-containing protein [Thermoanaerobaculia bacterium]
MPTPRTRAAVAATCAAVAALLFLTCQTNDANERWTPSPPSARGGPTVVVSPQQAPPGTPVSITATGFPAGQEVGIGAGPPRSEYGLFARGTTDARGGLRTTVTVPQWAEPGDTLIFAVTVLGTDTAGRSDLFRVLTTEGGADDPPGDGDGTIEVTGTLTGEGVECQALRAADGDLYTLTGDLGDARQGDRVRVRGTIVQISYCMQGTTIAVTHLEPVESES